MKNELEEQIIKYLQEQQPAKTRERITAGKKSIIGQLEQQLMAGWITTDEYKKRKAEYIDAIFELYIRDIITYDELKEKLNK